MWRWFAFGAFKNNLLCYGLVFAGAKQLSTGEEQKLLYTSKAIDAPDPFQKEMVFDAGVQDALAWMADKTPTEIIEARESMILALELANHKMWKNGFVQSWFDGCDSNVARVRGYKVAGL